MMSPDSPNPTVEPLDGPDLRTRLLIALLLRIGLGLSILNAGLVGYLQLRAPGRAGNFFGVAPTAGIAFESVQALHYTEIVVGVALLFGFLTSLATVAAMVLQLLHPLLQTLALLIYQGQGPPMLMLGMEMVASPRLMTLMVGAAVLWLSAGVRNPYSIDSLVFRPSFRPETGFQPGVYRPPPVPVAYPPKSSNTDAYLSGPSDENSSPGE